MDRAEQTVRIGIFGASGSGKSYCAKRLIEKHNRIIVFDVMSEYWNRKGFSHVNNISALKKELCKNWHKGFKIAYIPNYKTLTQELSQVSDLIFMAQADYSHNRLPIVFVVEELSSCYPVSGKNAEGFSNLAARGRHRGIHIIGISQRISEVNTTFRGNCTSIYIYRPADHVDIDVATKILGRKRHHLISIMRNYEYFYLREGKVTFKGRPEDL